MLHFRKHVPQVLGVHAAPAVPGVRLRRRPLEGRGTQILIDARRPARRKFHEWGRDSGGLHAFIDVIGRDARNAQAALQLVLAQPAISSQLVDNLNASIHLRALLTDLFLIDEVLKNRRSGDR